MVYIKKGQRTVEQMLTENSKGGYKNLQIGNIKRTLKMQN